MSRHYEKIKHAIEFAKENIVDAMMHYVLANGEDFSDYHRNEFGIEEEEDGAKVLKVMNIFDNGGCCFPYTHSSQVEEGTIWYSCAFHCLCVEELDGVRHLKYYMLWNIGKEYDENYSEPDHNEASTLPLQVLDKLVQYIEWYEMNGK